MHRFDLEIEGHHTYLADGVVVHNSPETTTGGRALKFYSSIRLDIRRQDTIKNGTEAIGVRTKVKVVKNKLAPPFREAEFDVIYGEGISKEGTVLDAAAEHNIVEKSGTWYTLQERAHRAGARECQALPQGQPEDPGRRGDQGARGAGPEAGRRRAAPAAPARRRPSRSAHGPPAAPDRVREAEGLGPAPQGGHPADRAHPRPPRDAGRPAGGRPRSSCVAPS